MGVVVVEGGSVEVLVADSEVPDRLTRPINPDAGHSDDRTLHPPRSAAAQSARISRVVK